MCLQGEELMNSPIEEMDAQEVSRYIKSENRITDMERAGHISKGMADAARQQNFDCHAVNVENVNIQE